MIYQLPKSFPQFVFGPRTKIPKHQRQTFPVKYYLSPCDWVQTPFKSAQERQLIGWTDKKGTIILRSQRKASSISSGNGLVRGPTSDRPWRLGVGRCAADESDVLDDHRPAPCQLEDADLAQGHLQAPSQ